MTTKENITQFFTCKNFAVVGVSRSKGKFANTVYKELKKKDFNLYGVNPNLESIEGDKCYNRLFELKGKIDAVINVVKPNQTENIVKEAHEIGIKNIWLQQGSESDEVIKFCKENGINVIYKECILMFAEPVKSIHGVHKWIWKVLGKLPK